MAKKGKRQNSQEQHMQDIYRAYMQEMGVEVIRKRDVYKWAIQKGLWTPPRKTDEQLFNDAITRAMRNEVMVTEDGKEIRLMHAAKRVDGRQTIWDWGDIRTASRPHMHAALSHKREAIKFDVFRHADETEWFNKNNPNGIQAPLEFSYDFRDDLLERDLPTEYPEDEEDFELEAEPMQSQS